MQTSETGTAKSHEVDLANQERIRKELESWGYNHPAPAPAVVGSQSYRDVADANRARLLRGLETGPVAMFLAPNEGCVISLGGTEYVSRRDHQYGFVWELPVRPVNEFLQGQKLSFGKKGKDWVVLQLRQVSYQISSN
jgi:hypothetical protein